MAIRSGAVIDLTGEEQLVPEFKPASSAQQAKPEVCREIERDRRAS